MGKWVLTSASRGISGFCLGRRLDRGLFILLTLIQSPRGMAMKRATLGLFAVVGFLMAGMTAWAHHSVQAEFDLSKPLTITGVVTTVEWINQHSYLYLVVKAQ